jgi:hypothetical protein
MDSVLALATSSCYTTEDFWEFAPKRYLRISQDIPRYPKISIHEDKYGYLFKDIIRYLLDMSGYLFGIMKGYP